MENNNISEQVCKQINDICEKFFTHTKFTYFNYVKVYNDGTRICLSNNYQWMSFVFANINHYHFAFEENRYKENERIPWDITNYVHQDKLMNIAKNDFNLAHGMTLINNYKTNSEYYYFATQPGNDFCNAYYLDEALFSGFILYFKDKAHELIQNAEKRRLVQPSNQFRYEYTSKHDPIAQDFQSAFKDLNLRRFYLGGNFSNTYLTKREAECLTLLSTGCSVKNIAAQFQVSERTIREHFDNIKYKLNCYRKADLLRVAYLNGFQAIRNVLLNETFCA